MTDSGMLSPTPHYYEVRGRAAEIARTMGSGHATMEHLFLVMLHDGVVAGIACTDSSGEATWIRPGPIRALRRVVHCA